LELGYKLSTINYQPFHAWSFSKIFEEATLTKIKNQNVKIKMTIQISKF
jgi:hypothetical protein